MGGPRRERGSFKHLGNLTKLTPYLRRYGLAFALALLTLLVLRWFLIQIPQLKRITIDSLTLPGVEPNYIWPAILILGIIGLQFAMYVPARRVLRRIAISVAYDLRKNIFRNVQYQSLNFFHKFSTGDLMSRAINDVNQVRMCFSFSFVQIITFLFTVTLCMYQMLVMSTTLAIVAILPFPFVAWIAYSTARGMYPHFIVRQEAMANVNSFTQENLNGIRTIQAMAQESREIEKFHEISTQYTKKAYRASRYMAYMHLAMTTSTALSPLLILGYGGYLVINEVITVGALFAFFLYSVMVTASIAHLGWAISMFTSAAAAINRIYEILDYVPEVKDSNNVVVPKKIDPSISIRSLNFSYPMTTDTVLSNVNMTVKSGQTIAILGPMGAGKSTILRSMVRLVDTPRRSIYLDGHDICDLPVETLRTTVVLVPQYTFLFSTSIRDNVTYDNPQREDSIIWEAVDTAGMKDTVTNFGDQLETVLGERGVTLSGGQRQRTTLARGLIRDAPIVLLDDVFSNVDTEREERILTALRKLRANKTTVLISHRISTARHADHIYVLNEGAIVEHGSHEELIQAGGYYADLEAIQSNQDEDRTRRTRLLEKLYLDSNAQKEISRG